MRFAPQYVYKKWPKRFLALVFDRLSGLLLHPFRKPQKPLTPENTKTILVIRLDHLGDLVMTKPALAALRKKFPSAQIDLLVSEDLAPLWENAPEINQVLPVQRHWFNRERSFWKELETFFRVLGLLRNNHYDLGIDFRGDFRHILLMFLAGIPRRLGYGVTGGYSLLTDTVPYYFQNHQVLVNQALLSPLGIEEPPAQPVRHPEARRLKDLSSEILRSQKSLPQDDKGVGAPQNDKRNDELLLQQQFVYSKDRADAFSKKWGTQSKTRIVIHPHAGYPAKAWPETNYRELIDRLIAAKVGEIFVIGSKAEKEVSSLRFTSCAVTDLRGELTLAELPILFDSCQLYVGNDSGPAHIAAAQGTRMIILFSGTNNPAIWKPWTENLTVVKYDVPCSPCEAKLCPLLHHDCMTKISVDTVFDKINGTVKSVCHSGKSRNPGFCILDPGSSPG